MRIVVLCKRQYTNRDVIDDRYGRLWEIPAELARAGHSVTCLCLSYARRDAIDEHFDVGGGASVRWISMNLGRLLIPGLIAFLLAIRRVLRSESQDVVWSASDSIYTVIGGAMAWRHDCWHVADLYDNFESFAAYRLPFMARMFRKYVVAADGVSCVGERLRQRVVEVYGRSGSTVVITNAVDTTMFQSRDKLACRNRLGLPRNAVLVGAAGDMSAHRGADIIFQAAQSAGDRLRGVHVAVAGFRNKETRIPQSNNTHDLGMLPFDRVPALVASLDLAVVYNRASAFGDYCFPQKFFEVLACGVPLVAANVGELGILLQDYSELLYEDGDIDSFIRAVARQLKEKQVPDLHIPTWREQAKLLEQHLNSVVSRTW